MQTRVPEKSLIETSDLGILWGSEFVEVCDEVDVMILRTLWTPKTGL